jgi:hypothetical protein
MAGGHCRGGWGQYSNADGSTRAVTRRIAVLLLSKIPARAAREAPLVVVQSIARRRDKAPDAEYDLASRLQPDPHRAGYLHWYRCCKATQSTKVKVPMIQSKTLGSCAHFISSANPLTSANSQPLGQLENGLRSPLVFLQWLRFPSLCWPTDCRLRKGYSAMFCSVSGSGTY